MKLLRVTTFALFYIPYKKNKQTIFSISAVLAEKATALHHWPKCKSPCITGMKEVDAAGEEAKYTNSMIGEKKPAFEIE